MWSLSVEEQFYLVFPALLLLGWKLRRRPAVKVVLAGTIVASFTMSIILTFGPFVSQSRGTEIAFYAAPARAWEFAVGGVVALASARWRRMGSSALCASAGIGAGCVAFSCLRFSESTQFPGVAALLPVTGTALLIVAGSRPRQKRSFKILENSALVYIGDVSYGWYLWHWPLIVVAASMLPNLGIAKPAAAVGSFLVAVVMYRFYENPIRRRPPISQGAPVAAGGRLYCRTVAGGVGT